MADAANLGVQVIITPGSAIRVNGNKDQLLEVLVNLVKNGIDAAAQYQEKWVMVDVKPLKDQVQITVTDSGPGIPEGVRDKLFTPLFTAKGEKGTGLGLVIVQKIIKTHGGDIIFNEKNKNTQFVIHLPTVL